MKIEFPEIKGSVLEHKLLDAISIMNHNIKRGKEQNIKHKVYKETYYERDEILRALIKYNSRIGVVMKATQGMAKKYREQRITFLEKEIEKNLEYLLPDENFKIKIDFRTIQDRYYADLYIGDGTNWSLPKSKNGRFIRQLISFSAMYSVNKLRGSKTIFYDEALSSADPTSLTELKELFSTLIDEGFQIVMIEHKEQIYNQLSRKEIHLLKDRQEGNVSIVKEEIIDVE